MFFACPENWADFPLLPLHSPWRKVGSSMNFYVDSQQKKTALWNSNELHSGRSVRLKLLHKDNFPQTSCLIRMCQSKAGWGTKYCFMNRSCVCWPPTCLKTFLLAWWPDDCSGGKRNGHWFSVFHDNAFSSRHWKHCAMQSVFVVEHCHNLLWCWCRLALLATNPTQSCFNINPELTGNVAKRSRVSSSDFSIHVKQFNVFT